MDKGLQKVLFVDDEPGVLSKIERQFQGDFEVHTRLSGAEGLEALRELGPFPVVVSDMSMPQMDGVQFLSKVRVVNPESERILLTGRVDVDTAISAVNDGQIYCYLIKPCEKEALNKVINESMERYQRYLASRKMLANNPELQLLAMEDALLGIGNRREMEKDLDHMHGTAVRYMRFYSLILLDVDYFKMYNDRYGHQAGDIAFIKIASRIKNLIRSADRLCRFDGGKLLLLLPETNEEGAQILARRLVQSIFDCDIRHEDSATSVLTVSAGIGAFDPHSDADPSWHASVSRADKALHQAKSAGRNRVCRLD
ncbi:MAG: diguanylate cyclase [Gammaproteobacteria bacterium]|nr:diguanylate cyclase [Gammaproteobacteria bacterium]